MATTDSMFKNAVLEMPKTAFKLNNSLEGPSKFRKALIPMATFYYNKRVWAKINQGMIHIEQSQEITGVGLPLPPRSGIMQTAVTSTSNNVWQYLWIILNQGRSLKPWCSAFYWGSVT